MKVFISGSISIKSLNENDISRLEFFIEENYTILIGDAYGVDRLVQQYLVERNYQNVVVYFSGKKIRNNIGNWQTKQIPNPKNLTGRARFQLKDQAMTNDCDTAQMFWDGKSKGTKDNIERMEKLGKTYGVVGRLPLYLGDLIEPKFTVLKERTFITSVNEGKVVVQLLKIRQIDSEEEKIRVFKEEKHIFTASTQSATTLSKIVLELTHQTPVWLRTIDDIPNGWERMDELLGFTVLREKSFINQNNQEVFVKLSKKLDRIDLEEMAYFQIFREEEHSLTIPKEDAITMSEIILELTTLRNALQ